MTAKHVAAAKNGKSIEAVMKMIADIRERTSTERGATQAEAEAASSKMAELLLRYNLTLADIDAHAKKTARKVVSEAFESWNNRWKQDLLFVIANAHSCKSVRHPGNVATHTHKVKITVVGHEHNLIVVRETYPWLHSVIEQMAKDAYKAEGDILLSASVWKTRFSMGAVEGIRVAYHAMKERIKQEVGVESYAIVPVLESEVAQHLDELFPVRGKMSQSSLRGGRSAYDAGVEAGRNVNLQRQVGGRKASAAIAS